MNQQYGILQFVYFGDTIATLPTNPQIPLSHFWQVEPRLRNIRDMIHPDILQV